VVVQPVRRARHLPKLAMQLKGEVGKSCNIPRVCTPVSPPSHHTTSAHRHHHYCHDPPSFAIGTGGDRPLTSIPNRDLNLPSITALNEELKRLMIFGTVLISLRICGSSNSDPRNGICAHVMW
jgi:hypothetical protein